MRTRLAPSWEDWKKLVGGRDPWRIGLQAKGRLDAPSRGTLCPPRDVLTYCAHDTHLLCPLCAPPAITTIPILSARPVHLLSSYRDGTWSEPALPQWVPLNQALGQFGHNNFAHEGYFSNARYHAQKGSSLGNWWYRIPCLPVSWEGLNFRYLTSANTLA